MRSFVLSIAILFALCIPSFADDSPAALKAEIDANQGIISWCDYVRPQLMSGLADLMLFDWGTPVAQLAGTQWYEQAMDEQWEFLQRIMQAEAYLGELSDDHYLAALCNTDARDQYDFQWSTMENGGAPDWYQVRFELLMAQPRVNRIGQWIASIDNALRAAATAAENLARMVDLSQWNIGGM